MNANIQWKKAILTATVWLLTEILLNSLNLDLIADYGEFVLQRNTIAILG
jgi:hypothetical protein